MIADFCFANQKASVLLFLCLVIVILLFSLYHYRGRLLRKYWRLACLQKILKPRSPYFFWLQVGALTIAWALLTFALMDPQGNRHYLDGSKKVLQEPFYNLIFVVDTSLSMSIKDMPGKEARFEFSKDVIWNIVSAFPKDPVALYAFTRMLTREVPLTFDHLFFRFTLDQMGFNEGDVGGTDLLEAMHALSDSEPQKKGILILLSDGGDRPFEKGEMNRLQEIKAFLQTSPLQKWDVTVIGVGSKEGGEIPDFSFQGKPVKEPLIDQPLKEIAATLGGKYLNSEGKSAGEISKECISWIRGKKAMEKSVPSSPAYAYDHYFQVPLFFALVFLLLTRLKPGLFLFLFLAFPLFSDGGKALLQAERYFEAREFSLAEDILHQELDGDSLTPWERAVFSYDLGLVLMEEKKFDDALLAFEFAATLTKPPFYWFLENRELALSDLFFQLGFLQRSKQALERANLYHCNLQKELTIPCKPSERLIKRQDQLQKALTNQPKVEKPQLPKIEEAVNLSSPTSVLKGAIVGQKQAIEMQRQDVSFKDQDLENAERQVLSVIDSFQKTSLNEQFIRHQKDPSLCFREPWDKVFPLVNEGIQDGKRSLQDISSVGFYFQNQALKKWERAYLLLQEEKAKAPQEQKQEDLLQTLKEMDIMDRKDLPKKALQDGDEW